MVFVLLGKKKFWMEKNKILKKKDFCSHTEEVEVDSGKNYFFVKTEKRQKIKKRRHFETAELISSSFIIFLHRLMFTPVLTLQVVAGPRQSPLC